MAGVVADGDVVVDKLVWSSWWLAGDVDDEVNAAARRRRSVFFFLLPANASVPTAKRARKATATNAIYLELAFIVVVYNLAGRGSQTKKEKPVDFRSGVRGQQNRLIKGCDCCSLYYFSMIL